MNTIRIIRRDVGALFRISRNLREGRIAKIKRCLWGVVYLFKGFATGVQFTFSEQLGSEVRFEGRECFVSNWAGSDSPTLSDGNGWYQKGCDRSQIVNKFGIREVRHRFHVGFGWYMGSWYTIDVQEKIYPQSSILNNQEHQNENER